MVECIFTIDYELYGSGEGALKDLVYEPMQRLRNIFLTRGVRLVVFVEVSELVMIEAEGTDPDITLVTQQIRDLYREGFEIGLHLHPQWYRGRYKMGNGRSISKNTISAHYRKRGSRTLLSGVSRTFERP